MTEGTTTAGPQQVGTPGTVQKGENNTPKQLNNIQPEEEAMTTEEELAADGLTKPAPAKIAPVNVTIKKATVGTQVAATDKTKPVKRELE